MNDNSVVVVRLSADVETTQDHHIGRGRGNIDGNVVGGVRSNPGGPGLAGDGDGKGNGGRTEVAGIEAVDLAARGRLVTREGSRERLAWRGAAAGGAVIIARA